MNAINDLIEYTHTSSISLASDRVFLVVSGEACDIFYILGVFKALNCIK